MGSAGSNSSTPHTRSARARRPRAPLRACTGDTWVSWIFTVYRADNGRPLGDTMRFRMNAHRERALLCTLALVLVVVRSFVATYYEGFFFDSDQAIVGLMARHLSRLESFPLFYYGLNYLLGIQAWVIAPFFWLGRSSVGLARLPFVALNAGVAVWLIRRLSSGNGLRPAIAVVAVLPFILPTPVTAAHLLQLAGSCVEPFVFVLLLWTLRRQPAAFGIVLAIAFLHREFTIFALPALVLVEFRQPGFWSRANAARAARALAGFALAWLVVDDLKMHLLGTGLVGQAASLGGQMCGSISDLLVRVRALVAEALPILYGGRPLPLAELRLTSSITAGSSVVGWLVAATFVMMAVETARLKSSRSGESASDERPPQKREGFSRAVEADGFGAYLTWVGFLTASAYPLSCNVLLGGPPLLRYLLLALLLPIGLFVVFVQRERSRVLRGAAVGVFVVWGVSNLWDSGRLIREALHDPPGSEHRALTDYLLEQRIRYARATYWDAYVVDFFSGERVIVASVDTFRIPEYQKRVEEHADAAVNLERMPCNAPRRVAAWGITGP